MLCQQRLASPGLFNYGLPLPCVTSVLVGDDRAASSSAAAAQRFSALSADFHCGCRNAQTANKCFFSFAVSGHICNARGQGCTMGFRGNLVQRISTGRCFKFVVTRSKPLLRNSSAFGFRVADGFAMPALGLPTCVDRTQGLWPVWLTCQGEHFLPSWPGALYAISCVFSCPFCGHRVFAQFASDGGRLPFDSREFAGRAVQHCFGSAVLSAERRHAWRTVWSKVCQLIGRQ